MLRGLYTAASGMMAVENQQAVISNNIANAATVGFKRQSPINLGFQQVFSKTMRRPGFWEMQHAPGGGVKMVESYPNLSSGPMQTTGNPLDVALSGPGYIAVNTAQGERFTRDGSFTVDVDGSLATRDGSKVQSVDGAPIDARGGKVAIGDDGTVRVGTETRGRIRLVEFQEPKRLKREGNNLFSAGPGVSDAMMDATGTQLAQGTLEMSNVNLPTEMIQMILGSRAYDANQKIIAATDETISQLIQQVAAP